MKSVLINLKCHLCSKTDSLVEEKVPPPVDVWFGGATCFHSPDGWTYGYNYTGDRLDFCSKDHKEYYDEAREIGPPAIQLVLKIFRSRIENPTID